MIFNIPPPPRFICYSAHGIPFGQNRLFYTFIWSYFFFCERVDKIAFRISPLPLTNSNSPFDMFVANFRRTVMSVEDRGGNGTGRGGCLCAKLKRIFASFSRPVSPYDYSRPMAKSPRTAENRNHITRPTKKQEQRNYIPLCYTIYFSILNSCLAWFSVLKHLSTRFAFVFVGIFPLKPLMCKTHNVCGKVPLNEIGIRAITDRAHSEMSPHIKVPVEFELLTAPATHPSAPHSCSFHFPSSVGPSCRLS